ncbi:hypothetical protein NEFER03_1196 [Nematocida sp. LUAm3]|nr:hypothetical protein NEFER03_1196 [Nematocida sp. LUAm3]KAI5175805.1 hypothetical protein NEFER02_1674 [Nematocida sp. LUAm2]KAI5178301.1 hypothetical protein NEFER01_1468 [Nematocida sp. LUAm1]
MTVAFNIPQINMKCYDRYKSIYTRMLKSIMNLARTFSICILFIFKIALCHNSLKNIEIDNEQSGREIYGKFKSIKSYQPIAILITGSVLVIGFFWVVTREISIMESNVSSDNIKSRINIQRCLNYIDVSLNEYATINSTHILCNDHQHPHTILPTCLHYMHENENQIKTLNAHMLNVISSTDRNYTEHELKLITYMLENSDNINLYSLGTWLNKQQRFYLEISDFITKHPRIASNLIPLPTPEKPLLYQGLDVLDTIYIKSNSSN